MPYVLLNSQPGILETFFSKILNVIFDFIYSISPVYSLGIAIILFTILIKVLLLPIALKQYTSTKKMKIIQPEMKIIQDKYKDKKDQESQQKMVAEMNALYGKHGTTPLSGCLPALIQIPIIFALFNVLRDAYIYISELSNKYDLIVAKVMTLPNYKELFEPLLKTKQLLIKDINSVDNLKTLASNINNTEWTALINKMPDSVASALPSLITAKNNIEGFFTINLTNVPSYTDISILIPIITALTTYLSIKVTSASTKSAKDPKAPVGDDTASQIERSMATMIYFIPGLIFITAFSFPSGLGIYWLLGNIFSIFQQLFFDKYIKVSTKDSVKNAADTSFVASDISIPITTKGGVVNEVRNKRSKKRK
ncbi:MAG TPA: hypothetical protein DCP90_00320 [Clostridiales bacterium]|nr:MAG: hypothetical protein A2Y22_04520 [Clostridiales bacterium GWD2_32_59]HAN09040.1 hypothetical protein [Clostridiales bacterium]